MLTDEKEAIIGDRLCVESVSHTYVWPHQMKTLKQQIPEGMVTELGDNIVSGGDEKRQCCLLKDLKMIVTVE